MRIYIVIVLFIAVSFLNNVGAKEDKKPVLLSAEELCSKLLSDENAFKTFNGTEITIYGKLSSVGDKRKAYLGNRMDSVVDLVITPQPKKEPFGKDFTDTDCYISCLVNVPGEQCEYIDGEYECKEITNPKYEENKRFMLELSGGESITVRGKAENMSLIPLYSIGGHKKQIVNIILSKCEIVRIERKQTSHSRSILLNEMLKRGLQKSIREVMT